MKSNITILDDTTGTGQYRFLFAANLLWATLAKDEEITVCKRFPPDPNFLATENTIMIQRWSLDSHLALFNQAVLPACRAGMANLIYNIDDCVGLDIPLFNRAHRHYSKPETQRNIRHFLSNADFLLVTTKELKQYYIDVYGVDPNNFIIMPNLLPRSWAYGYYNEQEKVALFSSRKKEKKIRVGLICSASHFNISELKWSIDGHDPVGAKPNKDNLYESYMTHKLYKPEEVELIPDDIDDILDVIEETADQIEWVSLGFGKSPRFTKLVKEQKIKILPQVDIAHYMKHLSNCQFDAVIAPIKDTRFNHCKSDIKYLECAAVGALLFATKCLPYTEHVPENQLFTSNKDLKEKLLNLYNMSDLDYGKAIAAQYEFINTPIQIPDGPMLRNFWLDDNLNIWKSILFMPRNGMKIPIKTILVKKLTSQNENNLELPYSNDIDKNIINGNELHPGKIIQL